MRIAIINGRVCTPEEARISIYDRGFLYGDSIFETVRTYNGKAFALGDHLDRLARSSERLFIELPVSLEVIATEVEQGITLAQNPESFARIMITRGTGPLGLDPALAHHPNRVILIEPFEPPSPEAYRDGIGAITFRTVRATDATPAAGAKVANYLTSVLAIREARKQGATEAFIVDGRGCVLEGTTSNVFLVKDGRLVTAPEESGILSGITRAYLLHAAEHLGLHISIRDIREEELIEADELFISSTLREVLPVVHLDGRPVGGGKPGALTRQIHAEFRKAT
ncbi:MAG TPA: aminotransferase class IV [Polyangiaceae bacterium]|nr:aminotransferase class IV [Polyangiaceae bacterium]